MKHLGISTVIALLLTLAPVYVHAQFVHGYVYDATDSTAIASAHVEGKCDTTGGYFSTYTDSAGYYNVPNDSLPGGIWLVIASHPDYYSQKKEVQLPRVRHLNFYLAPKDTIK